ncbi:MAG: histidine-type phosphatase [Bacteroidales bacterium]|nr:histidine-type phosphatase [Bacteroidales bacterium]
MKLHYAWLAAALVIIFCASRPVDDGYKLEQVVVLSRHNIRAPLTSGGSVIDSLTPPGAVWHKWSAPSGQLTLKGGVSETIMGQYFRQWLEDEGLIPLNWKPSCREALFYSNSLQRTIATARYFASGLAPSADIKVKYKRSKGYNLTFLPILTTGTDRFRQEAAAQRKEYFTPEIKDSLDKCLRVLERVLDGPRFNSDDFAITDLKGHEPSLRGSIKFALSMSDALVLQSYEEPDLVKAAFGHRLSPEDWGRIAAIVAIYEDLLFCSEAVCANAGKEMARELSRELGRKGRIFSFLCGHDSTLITLLGAIGAEPYHLAGALEKRTPIGTKLVFERYSKNGGQFVRLRMVYPSWEQLRELPAMNPDNPPFSCVLSLKGLAPNEDGYYSLADVQQRFSEAIAAGRKYQD